MEFGARFAHVEDASTSTAAHTAHHEYPEHHQQQEWSERPEYVGECAVAVVFHFTVKHARLAPFVHTVLKFIGTRNGGGDHSLSARHRLIVLAHHLLGVGIGDFSLGIALIGMYHDVAHRLFLHPPLKVGPRHLLHRGAFPCVIDADEHHENERIQPVDVEFQSPTRSLAIIAK